MSGSAPCWTSRSGRWCPPSSSGRPSWTWCPLLALVCLLLVLVLLSLFNNYYYYLQTIPTSSTHDYYSCPASARCRACSAACRSRSRT